MTNTQNWIDCIHAFLHDPPDKALDIKGHENRTLRYLGAALTINPENAREQAQKQADWLASALERLPLPKGTLRDVDGKERDPILEQPFNRIPREQLERCSPFSGARYEAHLLREAQSLAEVHLAEREQAIRDIAQRHADARLRAYALWRLLPDRLPKVCSLPGDTRLQDHSIIDHADASMAACAALRGSGEASLLGFTLGPVQGFISQGRSLRDLWTGSWLIAWLSFRAMEPILERLGPWAIVSPGLRGNAFLDQWLGEQGVLSDDGQALQPSLPQLPRELANLRTERRLNPQRWAGLPNAFTALVPTAEADELSRAVQEAWQMAWRACCDGVHHALRQVWGDDDWDLHWQAQCDQVWDGRCQTLPVSGAGNSDDIIRCAKDLRQLYQDLFGDLKDNVVAATRIAEALQAKEELPGYAHPAAQGSWQMANELLQRLLEASKRCRRVPAHAPPDDQREKCALMQGFAVMGPNGDTKANKRWWTDTAIEQIKPQWGATIRANERLSAPALVKRFAYPCFLRKRYFTAKDEFPDTREVAFSWWRDRIEQLAPDRWQTWIRTTADINPKAEAMLCLAEDGTAEAWQDFTRHELLDEAALHACRWPQETDALKTRVVEARRKLLATASTYGLPAPKPYYAILVADGDHMGEYLTGKRGPRFHQAYHPTMLQHLRDIGVAEEYLEPVRPQGPAAQLAFSACLNAFTREAPVVIEEHLGRCIYAGGDDVLAVLPVQVCLSAAADLARLFHWESEGGSLSAGIAIVHCQEDLRVAIQHARDAEAAAKRSGRDGLYLSIHPRAGAARGAYCPWTWRRNEHENHQSLVNDWQRIAELLACQSARWAHHLDAERASLHGLPIEAVWQRCRHHLLHGEEGQKPSEFRVLLDQLREAWADDMTGLQQRDGYRDRLRDPEQGESQARAWLADQFIDWCLHAAWLSRFLRTEISEGDAS